MYTKPSTTHLLDTVISTLERDILPEVTSSRGKRKLKMVQVVLQWISLRVQNEATVLTAEHNEMAALYRALAEHLRGCTGEAAARIQQRGATLGGRDDVPSPYPLDRLTASHRELSEALIHTLSDVDELLRAGEARASSALETVRRHLSLRAARDLQTQTVESALGRRE